MEDLRFEVDGIQWTGRKFGTGSEYLVAFHGYGQQAGSFRFLGELLGNRYTLLALDLAHHGPEIVQHSAWEFNRGYAKSWMNALRSLTEGKPFGLMGFSIGARVAMALASWEPEIRELWLIAPDGLPVSPAYRLITRTSLGNYLFRRFVKSPRFTMSLIRFAQAIRLLPGNVADFYRTEISTRGRRERLFQTWMAYRSAEPDVEVLRERNLNGQLAVICILGKRDAVIPFRKTKRVLQNFLSHALIVELDMGHQLLSEKAARKLSGFWKEIQ